MKIILLENIQGLGKKYDVKDVKDGYARNFLMPKKLVQPATENSLKSLESRKKAWEEKERETLSKLNQAAQKIKELTLEFKLKTGEKGEVFGSVSKKEIGEAIMKKISETDNTNRTNGTDKTRKTDKIIEALTQPLKTLGEHEVQIDLGNGVKTAVKVRLESKN